MMLQGKIFISTVNINKSAEIRNIFEALGASLIDFPMTKCNAAELSDEISGELKNIAGFDWIIFTSANGVRYFHAMFLQTTGQLEIPREIKIAVVGPKTALEVKKYGREADFTGKSNTAEKMLSEFIVQEKIHNHKILLALGDLAPDTASAMLSPVARTKRINVYNTLKTDYRDNEVVERIKNDLYDLILFTSPSGVLNFAETIGRENLDPGLRFASIGEVTTRAAKQLGLNCLVTAGTSTYEGLAKAIQNFYITIKN